MIPPRRADFLRAAKARRHGTPGFLLQARRREPSENCPQVTRVGFTCSKKIGNAVVRNRVKRRLRAQVAPLLATVPPGTDLVLRANPAAAGAASREIGEALARALETLIAQLAPVGAT